MLKSILKDTILKRMFKNASVLFSGQGITGAMGLISISLVARTLGTEMLGIFAMIQSYTLIIDKLLNFQSWQAIIKFGADFLKQDRKEDFKSLVKFCVILDAATAVTGTILAAVIVYFFGNWKGWQQGTIYATIVYSLWILFDIKGTATGLLRLFGKFRLIAAANVTAATLKLILTIIAFMLSANLLVFAVIGVAAGLAESTLLIWAGWRLVNKKTGDNFLKAKLNTVAKDRNIWKYMLSTNVNYSVSLAAKEMDVLITGIVLGAAATGVYKIARYFSAALISLIEPVYQAVYPELAHLAAGGKIAELKHIATKTAIIMGSVTFIIWLVFVFAGKWFLSITAGKEYVQAWGVMIIFMFAFVICGFTFCLPAGLLAMGKAGKNLLAQSIAMIIFLPALYLLLIKMGLPGAGIAQVVFFAVYALLTLFYFAENISKESADVH